VTATGRKSHFGVVPLGATSETAVLRFGTKDVGGDTPPVPVGRDRWIGGADYQFNYGGTW
jgi:hypothetical protein